jgi:hypothetical protein
MDEKPVREFWRLMEDEDVGEFVLAVFIEWVRKTVRRVRDNKERPSLNPLFSSTFRGILKK